MIDDENNLVLVVLFHVVLVRLFSLVLRFDDRTFHQQNPIERVEVEHVVVVVVVVYEKFRFLYSGKIR
jgi:hypothetical protein